MELSVAIPLSSSMLTVKTVRRLNGCYAFLMLLFFIESILKTVRGAQSEMSMMPFDVALRTAKKKTIYVFCLILLSQKNLCENTFFDYLPT